MEQLDNEGRGYQTTIVKQGVNPVQSFNPGHNVNANQINRLSKRLMRQLFTRMILVMATYLLIGYAGYYVMRQIFSRVTWYGNETFYIMVHFFLDRIEICVLLYVLVGCFLIFLYFWRQPFRYVQDIANATGVVYQHDDKLVELLPPLKDIEVQLNQIKVTAMNSERAAKEAEQRKNDLVAFLAHDLKTPITSVIGYLSLLHDEKEISEEIRQRYLNICQDKAERLDDLINEFFEITRFNLSHITLEFQQVHLTRMLNQLIFEFQPMLREKQLECTLAAPDNMHLRCDPDKLQRVFDNLLRNAVNYSFENSTIRLTAREDEKNVYLTFENDGNTISKEKLGRLFEQFYRLDTSRSSRSGGAGLGLSIAKEIVELHGGEINALSENDVIRFHVMLPKNNR